MILMIVIVQRLAVGVIVRFVLKSRIQSHFSGVKSCRISGQGLEGRTRLAQGVGCTV